ncbi:MAG: protein translocase SEC61 complex subunit gamma [archaeon]|jgi:protein transport protein SEC61 subunit gamma-like protein
MANKLKEFFESSKRILLIAKKPSNKEYWSMAKIVGLGMIIIGVIGFIVKLTMNLISGKL